MADLTHVTDGSGLIVTIENMKRSEFWGLANRLWSGVQSQEDMDDILGEWITDEKKDFLDAVDLPETAWDDDVNAKAMAKKVIVYKVGLRMLYMAQLERVRFNDAEYTRTIDRIKDFIRIETMNLKVQTSPVRVVSVQPQMLDPDCDYPNDNSISNPVT